MEEMATKVQGCISSATFGGEHLLCYRGIKPEDYVFSDESQLTKFLSLTEECKPQYSPMTYEANNSSKLVQDLHYMWNVPLDFSGSYFEDHQLIYNELVEHRTSWRGKYVAVFYSPSGFITKRYELQPLPDYIRWVKTGDLHYLPFEETSAIYNGPWMDIPDAFLPTKVLDLCFNVMHDPPENILKQISLLAWIPLHEVREYQTKLEEQLKSQVKLEQERLQWKQAPIYRDNTKQKLEVMCRQEGIPATPTMAKHQLCSLILQKREQSEPPLVLGPLYSGRLSSLPSSVSGISQITVAKLKTILRAHSLPYLGCKDELVLRVFMLKHGHADKAGLREKNQLKDLVKLAKELITKLQHMHLTGHVYRVRKYSTHVNKTFVPMPSHITGENNLSHLYDPLMEYVNNLRHNSIPEQTSNAPINPDNDNNSNKEQFAQIGAIVDVKWTASEVRGTDWKAGWYRAEVQGYCEDTDIVTLHYVSEPDETYEEELEQLLHQKKIKLLKSPI